MDEGCEIWQQLGSIDIANLQNEVVIEVERSQSVRNTFVYYGNKQASLTEWIDPFSAEMASHNKMNASYCR